MLKPIEHFFLLFFSAFLAVTDFFFLDMCCFLLFFFLTSVPINTEWMLNLLDRLLFNFVRLVFFKFILPFVNMHEMNQAYLLPIFFLILVRTYKQSGNNKKTISTYKLTFKKKSQQQQWNKKMRCVVTHFVCCVCVTLLMKKKTSLEHI